MDNLWIIYGYGWWFEPLWKIWVRQLEWWHSQLNGKIKVIFQTTNQYEFVSWDNDIPKWMEIHRSCSKGRTNFLCVVDFHHILIQIDKSVIIKLLCWIATGYWLWSISGSIIEVLQFHEVVVLKIDYWVMYRQFSVWVPRPSRYFLTCCFIPWFLYSLPFFLFLFFFWYLKGRGLPKFQSHVAFCCVAPVTEGQCCTLALAASCAKKASRKPRSLAFEVFRAEKAHPRCRFENTRWELIVGKWFIIPSNSG